jgi:muramoyltetrapeptide carboxypeptidase
MPDDTIQTILPAKLHPGDQVGIVAPSSPFDKKKFFKGIAFLEEIGLQVVFPENIF